MNALILITLKIVEYQLLGCVLVGVWYFALGLSKLLYWVFLRDLNWKYESLNDRIGAGVIGFFGLIFGIFFLSVFSWGTWKVIGLWINLNWSLVNLF